jgi:hypothetical protein
MHTAVHQFVSGKALQATNLNRFTFGEFTHAGLFTQDFGRANAGAHAAKDVLVKDRLGRSFRGASANLANEQRDIDIGGTGRDARRVMAKIATVCGDCGLMRGKGRVQVPKILGQVFGAKSLGNDTGGELAIHGYSNGNIRHSPWHRKLFYQMVKFFST